VLERHRVGEAKGIALRHGNLLGKAAVYVFADHHALLAELLEAPATVVASAAGQKVVKAHALTNTLFGNACADGGNIA
jgi:hypothetical protein